MVLAAAVVIVASCLLLYAPIAKFDDWMYHFPFSARLWNIGGGAATYRLDQVTEARWIGFPKWWHWIQGLFWVLTGDVRGMALPQLALCLGYFVLVPKILGFRWYWLVLGFFASPMLLIHFQALYIDLPAAVCLALGFFLLLHFQIAVGRRSYLSAAGAVAALGLAGNIKFQALFGCVIVTATVIIVSLAVGRSPRRTAGLLFASALAMTIACISAGSNFQRTGNPLYPERVTIGHHLIFPGPEDPLVDANPPHYEIVARLHLPAQPISFILSATELDWTLRGVAPWYSIDSRAGNQPLLKTAMASRTGGWGWLFVLSNMFVLIIQALRLPKEQDAVQYRFVIGIILLVAATAILPRSHELRYWLYLPLIMLPINLRYLSHAIPSVWLGNALLVVMIYGLSQAVFTPRTELLTVRLTPAQESAFKHPPPEIAAALRQTGRYCSTDPDAELFRFSKAMTGNRVILSNRLEDCAVEHQEISRPGNGL